MKDRVNRALFELECGILTFGILTQIVIVLISIAVENNVGVPDEMYKLLPLSIGLWIGIVFALAAAFHMWWSMDKYLGTSEDEAAKKLTLHYMIRYVAMALLLLILCVTKIGNPLTAFVGLMAIKFGAYLNGIMKLISNKVYGVEPPYVEPLEDSEQVLEK